MKNEKSLIERLEHEIANPDTSGVSYVNDPDLLAECLAEIKRLSNAVEPSERQVTTVAGIECMGYMGRHPSGLDTAPDVLQPCPFCGYEAAFKEGPRHTDDRGFNLSVWCTNGSCAVHTPEHYKTRETAAEGWNRRAENREARKA